MKAIRDPRIRLPVSGSTKKPESFQEISRNQAGLSPVFVTGMPRSGTTVFFYSLERHPIFTVSASAPGSYGLESSAFREIERFARRELPRSFRRFLVSDSRPIDEMAAMMAGIPLRSRRLYEVACRLGVLRGLTWKHVGYHHVVRVFFHFALLARQALRLLEKTPDHSLNLPEIWATYPRAAVFFLYRHPVNVYASFRKRLAVDTGLGYPEVKLAWLRVSPAEFAQQYDLRLREARRYGRRRPKSFMMICYETLISDPPAVFERACDFLNVPRHIDKMMAGSLEGARPRALSAIAPSSVAWQEFVEFKEARQIEDSLGPHFATLGFERYS